MLKISFSSISLQYGKRFDFNNSKKHFVLEGGVSYNFIGIPQYSLNQDGWVDLGITPDSYQLKYQYNLGVVINPYISIPLSQKTGLNLGFNSNFNKKETIYSIEMTIKFKVM
jgi:hypothetical protein